MTKPPIDFYFDLISPFAYIGSTQIEALAARHGRSVTWRPVLLGVTVLKIMGMKPLPQYPLKGPYLARDMARLALLHLNDGVWAGERLLPEGWVATATAPLGPQPPAAAKQGYGRAIWLLGPIS